MVGKGIPDRRNSFQRFGVGNKKHAPGIKAVKCSWSAVCQDRSGRVTPKRQEPHLEGTFKEFKTSQESVERQTRHQGKMAKKDSWLRCRMDWRGWLLGGGCWVLGPMQWHRLRAVGGAESHPTGK